VNSTLLCLRTQLVLLLPHTIALLGRLMVLRVERQLYHQVVCFSTLNTILSGTIEQISEYINITLDQQLLNQVAAENSLSNAVEIEHRVIFLEATILHVAQLLKSEVINAGLAGKVYTESLRNLLMIHLLRNYSRALIKTQSGNRLLDTFKLNQVKDFIEEHLAEDLTSADMEAVVHVSQFHFARAFKTTTGESPYRYLIQRRIERAKVLLSVTCHSIAEVAYRVGFYNQSHFTAQFGNLTGVTPKQYRDCL